MTNVIKIAQQGYDIETAADENLIFSSEWPLLKIHASGSFQISDLTQDQVIATHGLGYPAMFWYFTNNDITAWENFGAMKSDNRSEFFGSLGGGEISVNSNQLVFTSGGRFNMSGSLSGYYYIFTLDLTKAYNAPINNVGGLPANISSNRNFKIAKPGYNINDNNLSHYVIHSDTRVPLVQSVTPGTVLPDALPLGNSLTVYHQLSYTPMFFGYAVADGSDLSPDGNYLMLYTGPGGAYDFTADENKVYFEEGSKGRQMTIVILKDPFLVSYNVDVTK